MTPRDIIGCTLLAILLIGSLAIVWLRSWVQRRPDTAWKSTGYRFQSEAVGKPYDQSKAVEAGKRAAAIAEQSRELADRRSKRVRQPRVKKPVALHAVEKKRIAQ